MDTAQWPQEIVVKPLDEIVTNTCPKQTQAQSQPQPQRSQAVGAAGGEMRKARPEKDQALNCPRCNSTKTKFCYYNNYSLTQPRYFCKGCRRYWTEGGSLRNIPVGGGSRKNKRSHHQNQSTSNNNVNIILDHHQPPQKKHLSDQLMMSQQGLTSQNPKFLHETTQQDLNLGFSPHGFRTNFTDLIHNIGSSKSSNPHPLLVSSTSSMDFIRNSSNNGNSSSSSFMGFPIHNQDIPTSGFSIQDHYKPCSTNTTLLGFPLDHQNGFNGGFEGGDQEEEGEEERGDVNGSRHLFPFDDLKLPVSSSSTSISIDINDASAAAAATSAGYWTGMLSGGSW